MPTYYHELTVRFRGEFPVDMLRHDCCWPKTGEDAAVLRRSFERGRLPALVDVKHVADACVERHVARERTPDHELTVVRLSPQRMPDAAWTLDRWASFGCEVLGTEVRR